MGGDQIILCRPACRQAGFAVTAPLASFASTAASQAPPRPKVSAVVLAAGLSARMDGSAKMLLDVGGMPMIRRTVQNVLAFAPTETVIVTGHRAEDVANALADLPTPCIFNRDFAQGQPTSVAAGVRALTQACDAVMIMLGDQPLVTADHIARLASFYARLDHESILVPFYEGKRGNPILFASRHIPAVIGGGLNIGCRKLIETRASDVYRAEMESDVYALDCDTPKDYARLLHRLEKMQ
jgi:molybdenum cofactor cytidylyltransferase